MSKKKLENITYNFWTLIHLENMKSLGKKAISEETLRNNGSLVHCLSPPHSTEDSNRLIWRCWAALLRFWICFLPSAHKIQGVEDGCITALGEAPPPLSEFSRLKYITMFPGHQKRKQRGQQASVWSHSAAGRWWGKARLLGSNQEG